MGAHPLVFIRLAASIRDTKDRDKQDKYLDKWIEFKTLATEWDAQNWGFTENWMIKERTELMKRAKSCDPQKPSRRLDRGVS